MYTISGTVVCCGGFPVENATVILGNTYDLSDENGKFELHNVPAGTHRLKVVHRSYETFEEPMEVSGNISGGTIYIGYKPKLA